MGGTGGERRNRGAFIIIPRRDEQKCPGARPVRALPRISGLPNLTLECTFLGRARMSLLTEKSCESSAKAQQHFALQLSHTSTGLVSLPHPLTLFSIAEKLHTQTITGKLLTSCKSSRAFFLCLKNVEVNIALGLKMPRPIRAVHIQSASGGRSFGARLRPPDADWICIKVIIGIFPRIARHYT